MRKVLIGCGIVAALFVVVLIVGGVVVSSWVESKFPDASRIEERQAEMRERFGDPDRFTPAVDGGLPSDRLEIFVTLRESTATRRDSAAVGLADFVRRTRRERSEDRGRVEKILEIISMAQGGTEMVSGMLSYYGARQQMQLDVGMGDGEYVFWHCLTAFSWLGWEPLASSGVEDVLDEFDMTGDAAELRRDLLRTCWRQLRNLRRDLEAKASRTPAEEQALQRVAAELDSDRPTSAAPFAGDFPADWAAVLEPYRSRIEAALPTDPAAIVLDLVLIEPDGDHLRFEWGDHRSRSHRGD